MKKQISALLLALLLLMSFAFSASALIAVEDETGIRYSDGRETATQKEQETKKEPSAFSVAMKKALERIKDYWKRHGVVTVIILLLVAIVVAIVISEMEQQKKREESRPPRRQKK